MKLLKLIGLIIIGIFLIKLLFKFVFGVISLILTFAVIVACVYIGSKILRS